MKKEQIKEKVKKFLYDITHDYDKRAMFFVFNGLIVNLGFMLTYIILYLCNIQSGYWYIELAIYYLVLIVGYSLILFSYNKWKFLPQEERLKKEKKLYLPLGIVIFFLSIIIFTLTYILYHYDVDTILPLSLLIVHGAYVFVRVFVSLILLIKKRKQKLNKHPLSFMAKHLSYIGILMSFVLTTNAFRMISDSRDWNKIILFRGEFFGFVILIFSIIFTIKGLKEYKK